MLHKFNTLQYRNMQEMHISDELSLSILKNNTEYLELENQFLKEFGFTNLNSFSFSKDGFLALLLKLNKKGKIAVSVGETQSLIDASNEFIDLGFELSFINLKNDGTLDYEQLKDLDIDFLFISSYIMDSFVKVDLEKIKKISSAKIISNASANNDKNSDVIYFDSYKLTGYFLHGLILFNDELFEEQSIAFKDTVALSLVFKSLKTLNFNTSVKPIFEEKLKEIFKDDVYFFVDNKQTLPYTLHFALKGIKARELIRTLSLDEIHITNGEGCSLGLSKPSRIIQAMGYDETTSRNAISLTFIENYDQEIIEKIVKNMAKKYRQIKVLNQGN